MCNKFMVCTLLLLTGCALPAQQKADIAYCSELTGGTGPMSRIGNDDYWDCLKTQPYGAEQERKYEENRKLASEREEKKQLESIQKSLVPHRLLCKEVGYREDSPEMTECVMNSYQNAVNAKQSSQNVTPNSSQDFTKYLQPPVMPKQTNCTVFQNTVTCTER